MGRHQATRPGEGDLGQSRRAARWATCTRSLVRRWRLTWERWPGTTSAGVLPGPLGVQVTRPSGPEAPGARLRSHWWLGSGEGRVQVGSDLGHDLLGAADPGLPAALAAGAALAARGWGRGPDGDLVPWRPARSRRCSQVTFDRRWWPNLPTPPGKPVTNCPLGPGRRSVAVALVTKPGANADRRARRYVLRAMVARNSVSDRRSAVRMRMTTGSAASSVLLNSLLLGAGHRWAERQPCCISHRINELTRCHFQFAAPSRLLQTPGFVSVPNPWGAP
jgi:hypothetical protein